MPALDLSIKTCLLAVLLGLVVLLAVLKESMRGVVVGQGLWGVYSVGGIVICIAVARVELLQDLAASLAAVLAFRVILRALLNSIAILHQCYFLPILVSP